MAHPKRGTKASAKKATKPAKPTTGKPDVAQVSPEGSGWSWKTQMLLMWFGMTGGIFFGWYFGAGNTDSGKEQPGVPFSLETQDAVPFTVIDIPGKGKGAIASRDIKQGELIIEERPLFLVPPTINSSPTDFIWDKLEDVTEEQRESFFNLSFVNFPADKDPETDLKDVALAIFETNAVSAGSSVGIFPRMARLNHGCSSAFSAVYTYREKEGSLVVYAIKDVQKGTELLITYSDTKQPREQRRAYLQKQYGFHCTCSVCSLPDDVSKASDNRLVEMNRHQSRLSQWIQRTVSGPEAIEHVRSIWKLGDEEGYWSERGRLAGDAVFVAAGHSDADAVREWALIAIKWFTIELGADSEQVAEMGQYVAQPQSHQAWNLREKMRVGGPGELV